MRGVFAFFLQEGVRGLLLLFFFKEGGEGVVIVRTLSQTSVNQHYQFGGAFEAECTIAFAVEVLVEDVAQALFLQSQTRDETVVAAQRLLVLQVHARHYGVDAPLVQLCETNAERHQKLMTCVLGVM